ncbi:ubiquitin-associated and SH3 domain-containing protein A isoform X3 [Ambystoma mexicanum]|uniref:ubiquitin-associated and SH3 domain-containing protein A isoform X3 n=1 Tax=Ambystoma mexicanum TaxID=8296 RepID=UPI0037E71BA3
MHALPSIVGVTASFPDRFQVEERIAFQQGVCVGQKALAATGRRSAEEAVNWLRSHHNDPSLDDPIPQEYAVYLCPSGPLATRLQDFWTASQRQCSRNRAHESFPHVTLCDFFTCEDQKVEALYEALKKAGDCFVSGIPTVISLSLHSSDSYIGFFINDGPAEVLKCFARAFATEVSILTGCQVKVPRKQLHMTLAHKFNPHHQWTLEQLAKSISPSQTCQWTADLYSRDMRFVNYKTLRALYQYRPQNCDELLLNPSDLVYVDPSQQSEASDGWMIATSHQTGCTGLVPQNYLERVSEAEAWVKQRSYAFTPVQRVSPSLQWDTIPRTNLAEKQLITNSVSKTLHLQLTPSLPARRRLLVVRHGERVDQVFGKSWIQRCLTADGRYTRPDLNFPLSLPGRSEGCKGFELDPPLSSCGTFQSRLVGETLQEQGLTIDSVYSAPALRCIQTAHHILQGLQQPKKLAIRLEPGLFEWTKWELSKDTPPFMSVSELRDAGYSVDGDYQPCVAVSALVASESYAEFMTRCSAAMESILRNCDHNTGDILIVGHGSALDALTRPLLRLPPKDSADFAQMVRKVPSLAMCCCVENKDEGSWQMAEPPVKALTHGSNSAFHWKTII